MNISVIIPAYNEESVIEQTVSTVFRRTNSQCLQEIIVADGGSRDRTRSLARKAGARVVTSPQKGRAAQMNCGARHSSGDILYFLHADSIPPSGFDEQVLARIRSGIPAGCFRLAFDLGHPLLRFYAWFTRFDMDAFRFGDQSLFITRALFEKIGGFREDHLVMEDQEIVGRIKKAAAFEIIPDTVKTSSRKYREVGMIKLQLIFTAVFIGYHLGISQPALISWYRKLIGRS